MEKLLFGISGLPLGDGRKLTYATGITHLKGLGLDAMELPFVRSVNVTDKNKDAIRQSKDANDFSLSAHGSYYINLNAADTQKQDESLARIIKGAEALAKVGGRDLVFHPGFYLGKPQDETYAAIRDNLRKLPRGPVRYCLETTGKGTQFGTFEELVALCQEIDSCGLCLDFAHIHARDGGALRREADFAAILRYVADELGHDALADLHVHVSGIAYGPKGERHHLPLAESDFDYKACLRALHAHGVRGVVINESPRLEHDALILKDYYASL